MAKLGSHPKVRLRARDLGLNSRGDCLNRLRRHVLHKVEEWVSHVPVETSGGLLQVVSSFLSLRLVFIRDGTDLESLARDYRAFSPTLRYQLHSEFVRSHTLGYLLKHPDPGAGDLRFIAFIDGRGPRVSRAYFTAWHEVAHLLIQPPQLAFEGFRRVTEEVIDRDPIESVVDQIAGELAFYRPFVEPVVREEVGDDERLTLDAIARVRERSAPEASFSSTANATVRLYMKPAAFVVVRPELKRAEKRRLQSNQLSLPDAVLGSPPAPALRAVSVFANEAAREAGLEIYPNMRIPENSVLCQAYERQLSGSLVQVEAQGCWETSSTGNLSPLPIRIEAARFGPVVYGLVLPEDPPAK